jgi:PhzF family phenazine biosynthesis protein
MSLEIHDYLAFTGSSRGGNRAAVVFGLDLESEQKMQALASSLNAPATVFVGVSRRLFKDESPFPLRLRFFTPEIEENICGHGTVAAMHALKARGELNGFAFPAGEFQLETNLGLQGAKLENGVAWLEYPDPKTRNLEEGLPNTHWGHALVLREEVAVALGLRLDDLHEDLPVMVADAGRAKLICALPSTVFLDAIEPDYDLIRRLCLRTDTTGIVAFTFPGRGGCFTDTRHFSFQKSVLEDVATGNAHAALAAYLARTNFFDDGQHAFSGAQGYAAGKPSRLELRFRASGGEVSHVWVGGNAIEVKS